MATTFRDFHAMLTAHHISVPYQLTTELLDAPLDVFVHTRDGIPSTMMIDVRLPDETTPSINFLIRLQDDRGIYWDNQYVSAYTESGQPSSLHQALQLSAFDLRLKLVYEDLRQQVGGSLEEMESFLTFATPLVAAEKAAAEAAALAEAEALAEEENASDGDSENPLDGTSENTDSENGETDELATTSDGTDETITTDSTDGGETQTPSSDSSVDGDPSVGESDTGTSGDSGTSEADAGPSPSEPVADANPETTSETSEEVNGADTNTDSSTPDSSSEEQVAAI